MYNILKDLEARIERTEKLLETLKETKEFAENNQFYYRVTLVSAWSEYGEKTAVGTGSSPELAELHAEEQFREINNRNDVQASHRTVVVVFPNEFTFQPHEFH